MAELIALYIVCKNIGAIARSHGVRPRLFQKRAVILWIVFELVCGFVAAMLGLDGVFLYLAAFAGALLSLHFSFRSVREAIPERRPASGIFGKRDDQPL